MTMTELQMYHRAALGIVMVTLVGGLLIGLIQGTF
jgi:hypothetical protein